MTVKAGDRSGLTPADMLRIDGMCDRFEAEWGHGLRPRIEDFLGGLSECDHDAAFRELLALELALRRAGGEQPSIEEYAARFPGRTELIECAMGSSPSGESTGTGAELAEASTSIFTIDELPNAHLSLALPMSPVPEGYELLEVIGRGGMGVVYRARQVRLNRLVALKMISSAGHASPEALVRFLAEAESIARLRHPNVVQVYDRGECDGLPFYSMEFFAAGSLGQRMDGTPWPVIAAARIVEQVACGIAEVHRLGIVHRDLKPANILLADDGTPKVADFGLAKSLESASDLTRSERVLGTPSYMAPEQAEGHTRTAGPPADVYSLGAIFYELLTGRPPFKGATPLETLVQVRTAQPVSPSRLVPGLARDAETIALKCLQKDAARRYPGAAELAEDLRRFVGGEIIVARRSGPLERAWNWALRHRAVAALSAALLLTLTSGLAGVTWKWREAVLEGKRAVDAEAETARQLVIASTAREEADLARARAIESRDRLQRQTAELTLDRGLLLAERGEVRKGLHWMLEGLRLAPLNAQNLHRVARTNLAAWSQRVHAPKRAFAGGPAGVTTFALASDGRRLFAADSQGTVRCWDVASGAKAGPDLSHPGAVPVIAISPDGQALLAGGDERVSRIWTLGSEPKSTLLRLASPVRFAVFAPDGRTVITASGDGVSRLWDVAKALQVREIDRACEPRAAFLGTDGRWKLVHIRGSVVGIHPGGARGGRDLPHVVDVVSLALSADGETILTASAERLIRIWNAADGRLLREISIDCAPGALAFSPDGRIVLAGDERGMIHFWDARTGGVLGEPISLPAQVNSFAFGATGLSVFTSLQDGSIWQWSLAPDLMVPPLEPWPGIDESQARLPETQRPSSGPAIHGPDGAQALVVDYPLCRARLWDVARQRTVGRPLRHEGWMAGLAFSPDGRRVATGSVDATARIWDTETGQAVTPPLRHGNYVQVLAFSADGSTLASGDYDRLVHLWDANTGERKGAPLRQAGIVWSLRFSPDDRSLAVGMHSAPASSPLAVLWDLVERKTIGRGFDHNGPVTDIRFVGKGQRLWTCSAKETRLWNAATGEPIGPAIAVGLTTQVAALAPDGVTIVTGNSEGTGRLWNGETGQPIGPPIHFGHAVCAIKFNPTGDTFVVGTEDGLLRLFDRATTKPLCPGMMVGRAIIALDFTEAGRSILATTAGGLTLRRRIPFASELSVASAAGWIELLTGQRMAADQSIRKIDPAEWRARVDSQITSESAGLGSRDADVEPESCNDFAAWSAMAAGDSRAAIWHVGALNRSRPGDWLPLAKRAAIHLEAGRIHEAAADCAHAVRLGPADAVHDWLAHRAVDSRRHHRLSDALWYLNRLIEARPAEGTNFADRSEVFDELGDETAAAADRRRALRLGIAPEQLVHLAEICARRGQWSEAAPLVVAATGQPDSSPMQPDRRVLVFAKARDRESLHQLALEIEKRLSSGQGPLEVNNLAWALALWPESPDRYHESIVQMERALAAVPAPGRRSLLNTLGAILYRAGRHRDAIDRLVEGIKLAGGQEAPQDWAFLAMAAHKLGRTEEARRFVEKLRNWRAVDPDRAFWENLEIEVLREETEEVLKEPTDRGSEHSLTCPLRPGPSPLPTLP